LILLTKECALGGNFFYHVKFVGRYLNRVEHSIHSTVGNFAITERNKTHNNMQVVELLSTK